MQVLHMSCSYFACSLDVDVDVKEEIPKHLSLGWDGCQLVNKIRTYVFQICLNFADKRNGLSPKPDPYFELTGPLV